MFGVAVGLFFITSVQVISYSAALNVGKPIVGVLEAQQELNEELAERPDICGLIDVVCEGEHEPTIEERIEREAVRYGVDPVAAVTIAGCESSLNQYAENDHSTAKGLYQFTDKTWRYIKAEGHQFDADENIKQFMIWYPVHPEWWMCE
jgi:hypothetical protein